MLIKKYFLNYKDLKNTCGTFLFSNTLLSSFNLQTYCIPSLAHNRDTFFHSPPV